MAGIGARLLVLLDAALPELTAATNLFDDWFPADPNVCVALVEQPGLPPTLTYGCVPVTSEARLQVKTRAAPHDVAAARTLAWAVHRQLWTMADVAQSVASDPVILAVLPAHDPVLVERDDQDRPVFVANYNVSAAWG